MKRSLWHPLLQVVLFLGPLSGALPAQQDYTEMFYKAVRAGDVPLATKFLDLGVAPDAPVPGAHVRWSALAEAVQRLNVPMAKVLLDRGANPNLRVGEVSGEAVPPIFFAIHGGKSPAEAQLVDLLLKAGSDPKVRFHETSLYPKTLLILAVSHRNIGVVKLLLASGADVNEVVPIQPGRLFDHMHFGTTTALIVAVEDDQADVNLVKLLLAAGADANYRTPKGRTVLDFAQSTEIIKLVLDASLSAQNKK